MRRLALLAAASALALTAPTAGQAARECDGFLSCIPVAGPWVAIPAPGPGTRYPTTYWQLRCPEGIVGGLDALLSDPAIDASFPGTLGSPVNPGITTSDRAVFVATYTGRAPRATSFQPFIGCIPTAGGGRTLTSLAALPPGQPTVLRVRRLRLAPGRLGLAAHGCAAGERLISSDHAVGLYTKDAPPEARLTLVRVIRTERSGRILVSASRQGLPREIRVEVQIHAVCAKG